MIATLLSLLGGLLLIATRNHDRIIAAYPPFDDAREAMLIEWVALRRAGMDDLARETEIAATAKAMRERAQ